MYLFSLKRLCAAAGVVLTLGLAGCGGHADPAPPPEPDPYALLLNNISSSGPAVSVSAGAEYYVTGALLYQPSVLSSYFVSSSIDSLLLDGTELTITDTAGDTRVYELSETISFTPANFYALIADSLESGDGHKFLPPETDTLICRIFRAAEPNADGEFPYESIWEAVQEGQIIRRWISGNGRFFALIPVQDILPYVDLAQWTYDPMMSTLLPIRFDLNGPVSLSVDSGTLFSNVSLSASQGTEMEIEAGQTVYWQPAEPDKAQLTYSYRTEDGHDWQDELELRPLMDYCGLYGSKTYGISNNWLGPLSSAVHLSTLDVDGETGELVIYLFDGSGPYKTIDSPTYNFPRISGRNFPLDVTGVYTVQTPQ